jgi:hypothetical protein
MPDLLNVTTDDGKYTLIQREGGAMEALRHGEPWPAGVDGSPPHTYVSKRLLVFAQDLERAREENARLREWLEHFAQAADAVTDPLGLPGWLRIHANAALAGAGVQAATNPLEDR